MFTPPDVTAMSAQPVGGTPAATVVGVVEVVGTAVVVDELLTALPSLRLAAKASSSSPVMATAAIAARSRARRRSGARAVAAAAGRTTVPPAGVVPAAAERMAVLGSSAVLSGSVAGRSGATSAAPPM